MENKVEENGLISGQIINLKKLFFCATPIGEIQWEDHQLQKLCDDYGSLKFQKILLENTVSHPLVKKFPLKFTYQKMFLKDVISKLESNGLEVLDELYTAYCSFLGGQLDDKDSHFRHFLLNHHGIECITLKESRSFISHGTTGLCSWQAAVALADWCLQNEKLIHNKRILELGSGVGLTGLVVALCCKPASFWFSDCHPAVLQMLHSNILLNLQHQHSIVSDNSVEDESEECSERQSCKSCLCGRNNKKCDCCVYSTVYNRTQIGVLDLPWENIPKSSIALHLSPELILAADVVFDSRLFKNLCYAFFHLLAKKSCSLILACTIRNEETLEKFMQCLESVNLKMDELQLLPPKYILYSNTFPIKLYKISVRS